MGIPLPVVLLMWRGTMWDAVDKGPACIPNPRPRVWDTGRPGAHWRIEIPQASERGVVGGGTSLRLIPGPPLAVALATTQEGKSKLFPEGGPQSPFRQRTHLAWPPFSAPFYPVLWARLVSSGPGDFPFCRLSQTANGTPRHRGRGTLTLCGVGGTPAPLAKWAAAASGWRGHCCFSPGAS